MPSVFSRSGQSHPFGKLTAEIKTRVTEDTKDEIDRLAREAGIGTGEYIREMLMVRAHGIDSVRRLYERRLELVAGMQPEKSQGDE